jgi:hypothetical protein
LCGHELANNKVLQPKPKKKKKKKTFTTEKGKRSKK